MFELALLGVDVAGFLLGTLLLLVTLFLILLILVQRGKGGGLAGALGGMGGESALGTRAGDIFTKITVFTAVVWILLCVLTYKVYEPPKIQETADPQGSVGSTEGSDDDPNKKGENSGDGATDGDPSSEASPAVGELPDVLNGGSTEGTSDSSETGNAETPPEGGEAESGSSDAETSEGNTSEETSDQ